MSFKTKERICLEESGKRAVPCNSPEAYKILAGENATITDEMITRYGIPVPKQADAEAKAVKGPPADKQRHGPGETK